MFIKKNNVPELNINKNLVQTNNNNLNNNSNTNRSEQNNNVNNLGNNKSTFSNLIHRFHFYRKASDKVNNNVRKNLVKMKLKKFNELCNKIINEESTDIKKYPMTSKLSPEEEANSKEFYHLYEEDDRAGIVGQMFEDLLRDKLYKLAGITFKDDLERQYWELHAWKENQLKIMKYVCDHTRGDLCEKFIYGYFMSYEERENIVLDAIKKYSVDIFGKDIFK